MSDAKMLERAWEVLKKLEGWALVGRDEEAECIAEFGRSVRREALEEAMESIITLTDQRGELRRQLEEVQLSEARGTLAVETARLNYLFDNHAPDESLANAFAIDYLDGDKADEDVIAEIRRAWRQAIDVEMRKTGTDASDLHGCDPIREGSEERPEWENNPR